MTANDPTRGPRRLALVTTAVLAGAGLAAVYGIGGIMRNAESEQSCRAALEIAKRMAPFSRGEVAAVTIATDPRPMPELTFRDGTGNQRTLSDWRGRTVLLNLWATWCVPCRKEMPALQALQEKLGGPDFEVLAVNIDTRDPEKPKTWLKEVGIDRLAYYADPTAKVFQDLKMFGRAIGMPTTLLIDAQGCELATLAGPAEWASEDAVKLVRAALGSK